MSWKSQYPFESNFLQTEKGKIHYLDEGEKSKPPLLMLHGNPTWSFYWRNLIKELREDYRVIAVDHLGCGLSEKNTKNRVKLADHIANLNALIAHLKLKKIHLFVHDWGGAIGMGYATRNASNISSLVVFNTAAFLSTQIPKRIAICRAPILGKFLIQGLNAFVKASFFMATAKGFSSETKKAYTHPYNNFKDRKANYDFVMDIPMQENHPSFAELKKIDEDLALLKNIPMRIFWGKKDWCFDQNFLAEWQKRFPKAETTNFSQAGHYVVEDSAEEIIPEVQNFLYRVNHAQL